MSPSTHSSKIRFLDTALRLLRRKGYAAATIDELCTAAGLTKGSFFHHFESKEALGIAAAHHFAAMEESLFANAPYHDFEDPLQRLLAYVDYRAELITGETAEFTCLLGTIVQECYDTHPSLRTVCDLHIREHAATVAKDIAAAKALYAPKAPWTPESLGLYTQAVIQGAFILAKAQNDPRAAIDCVQHLRRYIETQFDPA